ncbi:MAG: energy-coupling factor transporter ATPase [Firmicutes bacterium]|nr:energy-coupling factor transporter ATPase [Bacillota bacterium]
MGIQFKEVTFRYKGFKTEYQALDQVNLEIASKGEIIGICGHTGSGKSTLVQHMNGLLQADLGTVTVFDITLPSKKKVKLNSLRRRVGLVFQFPEYQLFEETILKDVMFGPKNLKMKEEDIEKIAKESLNAVGIDASLYDQSPFRISGGQMRRVAIAGVLAMQPDILVLDEPTRGLDPVGQKELMAMLYQIHVETQMTMLIISHDMDLLGLYATRMLVMKEGRKLFDGSKDLLFTHPDFSDMSLDYPTSIKVMKHLNKEISLPFKMLYSMDDVLTYLEANAHE